MLTRRERSSLPRAGTNMLADSTHAGAATPVDVHRMSLIVRTLWSHCYVGGGPRPACAPAHMISRFDETTSDATARFAPAPRHPIRSRSPRARSMTR